MNQDKEELIFIKRMKELSSQAFQKGIFTFSDFLNLNEQNLFLQSIQGFSYSPYLIWGGYEEAERRVICFYEDDSFPNISFPITCIQITFANPKFSDVLTHRDYLGAILNLGIDRAKTGDILVNETDAFLFCRSEIAPFIGRNLTKIKHTNVFTEIIAYQDRDIKPNTKDFTVTVCSLRLDAVMAAALKASRNSLTGYITGGKVYVNSRLVESGRYLLKEGDAVSVRGMGKFVLKEIMDKTQKDRFRVMIAKYV